MEPGGYHVRSTTRGTNPKGGPGLRPRSQSWTANQSPKRSSGEEGDDPMMMVQQEACIGRRLQVRIQSLQMKKRGGGGVKGKPATVLLGGSLGPTHTPNAPTLRTALPRVRAGVGVQTTGQRELDSVSACIEGTGGSGVIEYTHHPCLPPSIPPPPLDPTPFLPHPPPSPPLQPHQPHPKHCPPKALQEVVWTNAIPGLAEAPVDWDPVDKPTKGGPDWNPADKPAKAAPELPPEWQMSAGHPGAVDGDFAPFVYDDVSKKKKKGDFDADKPVDPLEDEDPALWQYIMPDAPDAASPNLTRRGRRQPHGMGPTPGRWRGQTAPRRSRWMEMHTQRVSGAASPRGSHSPSRASAGRVWPEEQLQSGRQSMAAYMTSQNPLSGQQSWMHRPSWLPEIASSPRLTLRRGSQLDMETPSPDVRDMSPPRQALRPPPQAVQVCMHLCHRRAWQ